MKRKWEEIFFECIWLGGKEIKWWSLCVFSLSLPKSFLSKIELKLKEEIGHYFWTKMPMHNCTLASSTLIFFTLFFFFFLMDVAWLYFILFYIFPWTFPCTSSFLFSLFFFFFSFDLLGSRCLSLFFFLIIIFKS